MALSHSVKLILFISAGVLLFVAVGVGIYGGYKKGYRVTDKSVKIMDKIAFCSAVLMIVVAVGLFLFALISKTSVKTRLVPARTYNPYAPTAYGAVRRTSLRPANAVVTED